MIATAGNGTATGDEMHANPRASLHQRFGAFSVSDPRASDFAAAATATALEMASGIKQLALAGGISASRASAWRREGKGNPLHDLTEIVAKLAALNQHPGFIVAHVYAALHYGYLSMTDADLVRRFWELMRLEAEAEGRENVISQTFAQNGDLGALRRAMLDEAGRGQELAAVSLELDRRGLDPRDVRWQAR